MLPEPLRPKPGLAPFQLRVYEDFGRLVGRRPDLVGGVPPTPAAADLLKGVLPEGVPPPLMPPVPVPVPAPAKDLPLAAATGSIQSLVTVQLCLDKFVQAVLELERAQTALPQDLIALARNVLHLIASTSQREDATNLVAQRAILALFEKNVEIVRQFCCLILDKLVEGSPRRFAKDVAVVVVRQFEDGKHVLPTAVPVAVALARHRLISLTELVRIAQRPFHQASAVVPTATIPVDFVVKVVQAFLSDDSPEALRATEADLPGALETLARVRDGAQRPRSDGQRALTHGGRSRGRRLARPVCARVRPAVRGGTVPDHRQGAHAAAVRAAAARQRAGQARQRRPARADGASRPASAGTRRWSREEGLTERRVVRRHPLHAGPHFRLVDRTGQRPQHVGAGATDLRQQARPAGQRPLCQRRDLCAVHAHLHREVVRAAAPPPRTGARVRELMRRRRARLVVARRSITDNLVAVQNVYQSTDALARLVLFLARAQAEPLAVAHAAAGAGPARPLVWRTTLSAGQEECAHRWADALDLEGIPVRRRCRQPPLSVLNRFLATVVLMMTQLSAASLATKVAFPQKVRAGRSGSPTAPPAIGADTAPPSAWCAPVQVFYRLFLSLIYDVTAPDKFLDAFNSTILGAFVDAFHALRPSRVPQFAFAWLELISHRAFMPKVRCRPMLCDVSRCPAPADDRHGRGVALALPRHSSCRAR